MNKKIIIPLSLSLILGSFAVGAYESISSLSISATNVFENTLSGTEIADLSTIGGESPYMYYLTVSGAGVDSDKFYISGSKLYSNFSPDYENPSDSDGDNNYTIEIKSVDSSKPIKYSRDFGRWFQYPGGFYADGDVGNMYHIAGLMPDSSIYTAGPIFSDVSLPPIEETGFVDIATVQVGLAGLKADGTVKSWGAEYLENTYPTDNDFVKVYSSPGAFAALKSDGGIRSWGLPQRGGSGAPSDIGYTKIISNNSGFAALRNDGTVYSRGSIYTGNQPTDTGFVDIFANGGGAFAAIKADGSIKARGATTKGGSGFPTGTGFITVAGNGLAFAALKTNGSIVCRGDAARGGTSPTGTGYVKIYGGGNAFAALKADGSIKVWGHASYGGSGAPTGTGYIKIHAGNRSFSAMKDNGQIASRGYAQYGGTGAPTRAGFTDMVGNYYIMLALHEDGSLYSWGDPAYGGGTAPAGTGFVKIFALGKDMAALKNDGSIVYRGGTNANVNENPYRMGTAFKKTYDIHVVDVDDTPPVPTITYTEGIGQIKATLTLNESGVVTNNGGSFEYIFTQTGQFVFEFADLAGNTGTVIAEVDRVPGNGGGISIQKDNCPNGDNSPSYYDKICGMINENSSNESNGIDTIPVSESTGANTVSGVIIQPTWQDVYDRAKTNKLTTMPDFMSARLGDPITRGELAKVMVNYLKNKELAQTKVCQFNDIADQSEEIKSSIIKACQMGIMGVNIKDFAPNAYITRGEWSTILSRSLWGDLYENKEGIYYANHIKALKQKGILTNTDAQLQEARGYILLMLMRI